MQSFRAFPAADFAHIAVVLTDIDDTLTTDGRLPALAYSALESLRAAGLILIPVTGRPGGWCDLIARLWPVDGVVGENGALYFSCDDRHGMTRAYAKPDNERTQDRERLSEIGASILAKVPRARIAADQRYREADLAIDFAEDGPRLTDAEIDRITQCFVAAGATAKVSSIHVNGWYGCYNKLVMTRRLLGEIFGYDIDRDNQRVLFVGDSPNDAPMFDFFANSVAVANFRDFAERSDAHPRWITENAGAAGFAEVADALLRSRGAS
jgi:HAD superfamily hydrolase (TIGR01484 family)